MEELLDLINEVENGATAAKNKLARVKMALFNIKICVANIEETPDTRALSTVADALANAIVSIEEFTQGGIETSKKMRDVVGRIVREKIKI